MSALDRSKAEWMLVSINGDEWDKRLIIDKKNKIAISEYQENFFLSGKSFKTCRWNLIKKLPKKKTRQFSKQEFIEFLLKTPCFIKLKENEDPDGWVFGTLIRESLIDTFINEYHYKLISDGSIHDFVKEVE